MLDESSSLLFVIVVSKIVLGDELVVVHHLHVGALAKRIAESGLSGGLRSDDERNLGKHSFSSVLVDFKRVAVGINLADLVELLVEGDNGHVLGDKGLEALADSFQVVVSATLATSEDALGASLLRTIEEEHILCLTDISLKVGALINFSGESINKIVFRGFCD